MKNDIEFPETLAAAIKYFADADTALNFMASVRWPDGKVVCPCCHKSDAGFLATRKIWKCRECGKQFSVKVGTIFEDSALGFDKWLPAFWMIVNAKNGISSCELARALGVTQKTAWFMLHRIRLAMQNGSMDKLSGEVEADETYIGGKGNRRRHRSSAAIRQAHRRTSCGTANDASVRGGASGVNHRSRRFALFFRAFLYSCSRRSISDFGTETIFFANCRNFSNGVSSLFIKSLNSFCQFINPAFMSS
jgi:transposase-like protein